MYDSYDEVIKNKGKEDDGSPRICEVSIVNIAKDYKVLRDVCKEAMRKGLIKENFFDSSYPDTIEKPKSFKQDKKVVALTDKEDYTLKNYIKDNPNRYNNIILMCLFTGMRIGEVLALISNDIVRYNDDVIIQITRTLTKSEDGKVMIGDVHTHMLRHTFATGCIEAGVPIHVLQKG